MRIGIYGGSFNPPHTGHILAAAELIQKLALDKLLIVPAADPPHKALALGSPAPMDRLALCRTAFAGVKGAEICDIEVRREGKSYTVDTLAELCRVYPGDKLFLVMGTDMFLSFSTWREPERIASMATLAVMRRSEDETLWTQVLLEARRLGLLLGARVVTVENDCVEISSTQVRRMLAFGAPEGLEQKTLRLIREKGWYLTGDLKDLSYERLQEISLSLHDEKRRAHVVGTAETARTLAEEWGEDPDIARRAGILHDITKALSKKEQLHICEKYAMMPTRFQIENSKLLHAVTGAIIAEEVFGEPPAIVSAIRWHTTGRAYMSVLEKILYIADYIEPNRDFPGVDFLRNLAWEDLDAAVFHGLDQSVSYVRSQNRAVDPDSLEAWDYYRKLTERSLIP